MWLVVFFGILYVSCWAYCSRGSDWGFEIDRVFFLVVFGVCGFVFVIVYADLGVVYLILVSILGSSFSQKGLQKTVIFLVLFRVSLFENFLDAKTAKTPSKRATSGCFWEKCYFWETALRTVKHIG